MKLLFTLILLSYSAWAQDLTQPANFGSLYFRFERGGAVPGPQTLALGSDERRDINLISSGSPWLKAVPNSDGGPDILTLTGESWRARAWNLLGQPAVYPGWRRCGHG